MAELIAIVGLGLLGGRVCRRLPVSVPLLLVDYDVVVPANTPRQYPRDAIGLPKVEAARNMYAPRAQVVHKHVDLTTVGLLSGASLVIDCTDNLTTRFVLNDWCAREGVPWIHSAMTDEAGSVATFLPEGPCFACVHGPGMGEVCGPAANTALAERIAEVVLLEVQRARRGQLAPHFTRVTLKVARSFEIERRPHCLTCTGRYPFLERPARGFYITYCVAAKCMAAKPMRHIHDHGVPARRVVNGMPLEIYPNGEIHFLERADEDLLYQIAEEVYPTLAKPY